MANLPASSGKSVDLFDDELLDIPPDQQAALDAITHECLCKPLTMCQQYFDSSARKDKGALTGFFSSYSLWAKCST